jgi:hypothetical protein
MCEYKMKEWHATTLHGHTDAHTHTVQYVEIVTSSPRRRRHRPRASSPLVGTSPPLPGRRSAPAPACRTAPGQRLGNQDVTFQVPRVVKPGAFKLRVSSGLNVEFHTHTCTALPAARCPSPRSAGAPPPPTSPAGRAGTSHNNVILLLLCVKTRFN